MAMTEQLTHTDVQRLQADRVIPTCPTCGKKADTADGTWGKKHECCGLESWNYKPLTDRATLYARRQAHGAFDRLWKPGPAQVFKSRNKAYRWLSDQLGIDRELCHMSVMDKDTAERVTHLCRTMFGD